MNHSWSRRGSLAALLALPAAGCVRLLPEPPPAPNTYPLRPAVQPSTGAAATDLVIGVARPNAPTAISGLDVVWEQDGRIAYVPRSVWESRMPEALQSLLIATLDAQNRVAAGVRVGEGPRPDYDVRWDVPVFQVVEDAEGLRARMAASVKLTRTGDRAVVAARFFEGAEPLPRRSESQGVRALQALAQAQTEAIALWAAQAAMADAEG